MKARRPWYRRFNDTWYVKIDGKQVPLAKGKGSKKAALRRYCELMLLETEPAAPAAAEFESPPPMLAEPDPGDSTVLSICDYFLEFSSKHHEPDTYDWYRRFLQSFCNMHGVVSVSQLKPFHVTRWIDSKDWGSSGRHGAIASIKRALNWAVGEGLIGDNPLKTVKMPRIESRDLILEPDELKKIGSATDACFRLFLQALRSTGCRPGELCQLTADMVDLEAGTWTLQKHKTRRKTAKPRIVYLTPCMMTLSRILMSERPTGPLFLNSKGRRWHRNAIGPRLRRLRKKLGLPETTVAYAYRHTFATEGLANGVPIATMAELLGHVDTRMVARHYGHLDKKTEHLRRAVLQATQWCQREGA